jgi:hypothetical protein
MAKPAASNFQVSATGGAGSAGQPAQYVAGIDSAQDFQELESSAKMNKSGPTLPQGRSGGAPVMPMQDVTPMNAPTQRPDEHPATGAAMGPGAGPEVLPSTMMMAAQNNEDIAKLAAILPIYKQIAESPTASNATRNYVRWMESQVLNASVNK